MFVQQNLTTGIVNLKYFVEQDDAEVNTELEFHLLIYFSGIIICHSTKKLHFQTKMKHI